MHVDSYSTPPGRAGTPPLQAREARKKAIEEMNAGKKAELENIKFYKFYPVATPDTPDISGVKVMLINFFIAFSTTNGR